MPIQEVAEVLAGELLKPSSGGLAEFEEREPRQHIARVAHPRGHARLVRCRPGVDRVEQPPAPAQGDVFGPAGIAVSAKRLPMSINASLGGVSDAVADELCCGGGQISPEHPRGAATPGAGG